MDSSSYCALQQDIHTFRESSVLLRSIPAIFIKSFEVSSIFLNLQIYYGKSTHFLNISAAEFWQNWETSKNIND